MPEDIRAAGRQHVAAIQAINRDLVEKAFRMRAESYFAHVKSTLLLQTIVELDRSKKNVEQYNADLMRQQDTIVRQKRELAARSEALARLNAELERRVAERTEELAQANAHLATEAEAHRRARAVAEDMYRFKSAVLTNMSHEFRTPLSSILGSADLLVGEVDEERRRTGAERIRRNARRLLATLNDLLELAQLERGEVDSQPRSVDLEAECRAVAREFEPVASAKGLTLRVEVERQPAVARSDPVIVRRVLEKIVDNAVKFTRAGGVVIRVGRGADPDAPPSVAVEDTGVGIDPAFLPRLGADFTQADPGSTREFEGLGLGLALTRRYVALLGARLDVQSAPGRGTTVTIAWPAEESTAPTR